MKVIIITGTPGTGKTTIAKILAEKLNYKYIDGNEVIKKHNLKESFDKKMDCYVIDEKLFSKAVIDEIKSLKTKSKERISGVIIDSHLSQFIPAKYVDLCVVTKCSLKILESRLKKRGYKKSKVRENMDAEIFDVCRIEALENGHEVVVVDTSAKEGYDEGMNNIDEFLERK